MAWNGFTAQIRSSIIRKLKQRFLDVPKQANDNDAYIGKTERNLNTRLKEHLDPAKSAISKHLTDCDNANYLININNLYDNVFDSDSQTGDSPHYSFTNIIQNNTRILHSLKFSNSNLLLFLEALHIIFKKPELNSGLKASKELVVFP